MVTSAARPPLHFQNSILPPPCKNVWMKHWEGIGASIEGKRKQQQKGLGPSV